MIIRYIAPSLTLLLLILNGCATAISQTPIITKTELATEQKIQQRIIENEKARTKTVAEQHNRQQMLQRLQAVGVKISQAGKEICKKILPPNTKCHFPFALDKDSVQAINAYTDGKKIVVTPAMMLFAYDDNQLATVLAHEFAHAIMQHPRKTSQNVVIGGLLGLAADQLAKTQGIETNGTFSKIGAQTAVMRYSQEFEREADYIGMYILDKAGYNIHAAAFLWRRMAVLNPKGIYSASTHPTTAERYLLLEKTSREIVNKKANNLPLVPKWRPQKQNNDFFGGLL